jgi:hypothetical protein
MGRPLNKKYFGNRNFGSSSTTADDGLGGQIVTGITVGTAGTYTSAAVPTLTFPDPILNAEGGVTATGTPTFTAVSATVSGSQGGTYVVGQLLTVVTAGGTCTFRVASLTGSAVATVDLGTGAVAGTFTSMAAGAQTTTVNTGTGTGALLTITYGLLGATITDAGSGYLPATVGTTTITATGAASTATSITSTIATVGTGKSAVNTLTVTAVTGTITNSMILTGGSVTAGAYIVNQITPLAAGEATGGIGRYYIEKYQGGVITGTPTTGTLYAITVSSTVDIQPGMTFTPASTVGGLTGSTTYYVISQLGPTTVQVGATLGATASVVLTSTSSQSVAATFGQYLGVTVSGAGGGVATTALSSANITTNVNTGIRMTAFLEAADGGKAARQLTDIIKQVSGTRYKVENQDGTGIVKLTSGSITVGTGIITATDSVGGTYYVTKLTGHKATLVPKTGSQFPLNADSTPQQVQWTLGTPTLNVSVQIDNG